MDAAWIFDDGTIGAQGDPSRIHPWWSFSKTIIAAIALRLSADGRLDLDAQGDAPWTLRQLLQHRAGVPCYSRLKAYHAAVARREPPWHRERLMRELRDQPGFAPSKGWAYSNVGYMLAREAVETAAGEPLSTLAARYFAQPLGLTTMRLAELPEDFAEMPGADGYHPGWVYHGCFIGSASDAALLVHALCHTPQDAIHRLGGPIAGRPWTTTGYGLGVMSGEVEAAGRVEGHSGSGPFSCCAVYRFHDLRRPVSLAVFAEGSDEAGPEWEATRIARR
ncbi:serine hydrolase domain-containing protein [Vannielia litorea]|uniref:CubicO group peptidase, beta-lactamase class C family n=1 Tax=Vannielia litorea TaxID=1217970 RepID=A0A1N6HL81_9RHOB|nr:serine hydrolase domain-containing protein [Vannielia litorea]SIO20429.1 CubicO group peptidase, beta-lactamase class C family [Vannielia litorea]